MRKAKNSSLFFAGTQKEAELVLTETMRLAKME